MRKGKADRVGTAIVDLPVCGALPPYSEILGGKLVAMQADFATIDYIIPRSRGGKAGARNATD